MISQVSNMIYKPIVFIHQQLLGLGEMGEFFPIWHPRQAANLEIPEPIARGRMFAKDINGPYYPRIVPFGPFGFYENFVSLF